MHGFRSYHGSVKRRFEPSDGYLVLEIDVVVDGEDGRGGEGDTGGGDTGGGDTGAGK